MNVSGPCSHKPSDTPALPKLRKMSDSTVHVQLALCWT